MQSSCVDRWGLTAGVTAEEEDDERCGMTGSKLTISKQQQAEKTIEAGESDVEM